ncbi:hypothetical protein VNO77_22679 [Canavalia gladiata]|uniref:Uncharacterized protein n=1 Tax=Canavalia gladiata TaxID=3824 RepID=A0AAN9L5M8_CANGL
MNLWPDQVASKARVITLVTRVAMFDREVTENTDALLPYIMLHHLDLFVVRSVVRCQNLGTNVEVQLKRCECTLKIALRPCMRRDMHVQTRLYVAFQNLGNICQKQLAQVVEHLLRILKDPRFESHSVQFC